MFKRFSASILCASVGLLPLAAGAAEVALVGVFPGKAVLVIDGGAPRTLAVGQSQQGVKLMSVSRDAATVEIDGRSAQLQIGTPVSVAAVEHGRSGMEVTLVADGQGHFTTSGMINGTSARFLIDTGASSVAMGPSMAAAAGIDFQRGERSMVGTANGMVQAWSVKVDRLRIGDITLNNVDGVVVQADMPMVLLGMSVLNRMEMRRDGSTMVLRRRY